MRSLEIVGSACRRASSAMYSCRLERNVSETTMRAAAPSWTAAVKALSISLSVPALTRTMSSPRRYAAACAAWISTCENRHAARVQQQGDLGRGRKNLSHQLQPLWQELLAERCDPGDVSSGPVPTGDEPKLDRISSGCEDDWDSLGRRHCRPGGWVTVNGDDDRDIATGKIGRHLRQSIKLTCCRAIIDGKVLALDKSGLAQAAAESVFSRQYGIKDPDHRVAYPR